MTTIMTTPVADFNHTVAITCQCGYHRGTSGPIRDLVARLTNEPAKSAASRVVMMGMNSSLAAELRYASGWCGWAAVTAGVADEDS